MKSPSSDGQPKRTLCHHCGLPVAGRRSPVAVSPPDCRLPIAEARSFCCYGCYLAWRIVGEQGQAGTAAFILARLGVAGFLAMNVMMVSLLLYSDALAGIGSQAIHLFRWALLALSIPVLVILGPPFFWGSVQELRRGRPSVDSLIALGSLAGFGVSAAHVIRGHGQIYFDTAVMLLVLVTVGKLIEASARADASRALKELLSLEPPTARVLTDSGEREIPAEQVMVGDRIRIKPGEQVPVDGEILAGRSSVQEATFTGEFQPRDCGPGNGVFGGSANTEGEIIIRATAVGEGTLLSRIVRLVEQAQAQRAPAERLAARAAAVFVPMVLMASAGAAAYWVWRGNPGQGGLSALAVLVVACPCALGLATSLATCIAIARAARQAVLIRTGQALETLSQVSYVFFDKTGTLTQGKPALAGLACYGNPSGEAEALCWLASLESASEHLVGRAAVLAAQQRGLPLGRPQGFRAFPGQGAHGWVQFDGRLREVWAGTLAFLTSQRICPPPGQQLPAADPGQTLIFVGWDGQARARAGIVDAPRPDAAQTVERLRQDGVQTAILSGDRLSAVEHFARTVGVTEVRAEATPEEKVFHVRAERQRGRVVAVVGDGINDAPALAEADVGIAMGGGTDLAREAGEVILLGDGLTRIPWVLGLARRTRQTIRQNLAWAFGYNLAAIALAFFGYLHPLLAASLMLGSSVFVIRNSLRLLREDQPPLTVQPSEVERPVQQPQAGL